LGHVLFANGGMKVYYVGGKRFEESECGMERCIYGGEDACHEKMVMDMNLAELNKGGLVQAYRERCW